MDDQHDGVADAWQPTEKPFVLRNAITGRYAYSDETGALSEEYSTYSQAINALTLYAQSLERPDSLECQLRTAEEQSAELQTKTRELAESLQTFRDVEKAVFLLCPNHFADLRKTLWTVLVETRKLQGITEGTLNGYPFDVFEARFLRRAKLSQD